MLCSCAFTSPSSNIESGQAQELSALSSEADTTTSAPVNETDQTATGDESGEQPTVMSVLVDGEGQNSSSLNTAENSPVATVPSPSDPSDGNSSSAVDSTPSAPTVSAPTNDGNDSSGGPDDDVPPGASDDDTSSSDDGDRNDTDDASQAEVTSTTSTSAPPASGPKDDSGPDDDITTTSRPSLNLLPPSLQMELVDELNDRRRDFDLPPVEFSPELAAEAEQCATENLQRRALAHCDHEVLWMGGIGTSPEQLLEAWFNSELHKQALTYPTSTRAGGALVVDLSTGLAVAALRIDY